MILLGYCLLYCSGGGFKGRMGRMERVRRFLQFLLLQDNDNVNLAQVEILSLL